MQEKIRPEKWKIAPHVMELETSIIREILKFTSQPGVISFAGGLPAPEMFPMNELREIALSVLDKYGSEAVQYTLSLGILPLRKLLADRASSRNTKSSPENILITCGAQQGIELIARAFIDPGDYVLTANPTYVGAIQAFNYYQAKYCTVPMDQDGMLVDEVEAAIKKYNPKLIYTVSNFQNPTGITLSLGRREKLVELAAEYHIPIVDDNPYGEIIYSGAPLPTLKSLGGDQVIALRSYSKTLAPGLRIGWLNGPSEIIKQFEKVKQCADLHTNTFAQYICYEFTSQGKLEPQIERLKKDYLAKRDIMNNTMKETFPEGISWTYPNGGMFLWVTLPKHLSAKELLKQAVELKVAYVYGDPFYPNGGGSNTLRLNYSKASHESIVEGINRLGKMFKENI